MDRVLFLCFGNSEVFKDTSFVLDTGLALPLNIICSLPTLTLLTFLYKTIEVMGKALGK